MLHHFTKISYTTVILSFFLPFIMIKCNNLEIAKATGYDLVIGNLKEIEKEKKFDPNNPFMEKSNEEAKVDPKSPISNNSPNYYMIGIIVIAVLGLVLSFISFKEKDKILMVLSVIGILLLLMFAQTIDSEVIKFDKDFKNLLNNTMKISLQEGFYVCLFGFILTYVEPLNNVFTDQEISNDN